MTSVLEAIGLLDGVLGALTPEQAQAERARIEAGHLKALGLLPHEMGGIATKGCRQCGGSMRQTQDRDGSKQWVCSNIKCGAIE